MNKNYLHKSLAALLAAAALTGCAKDKEEFHYIDLSQVACTFQGEDNQPLTVSVITAPAAWSAAPDASWVTAEKGQDGESLTITVEDNTVSYTHLRSKYPPRRSPSGRRIRLRRRLP